MAHHRRYKRRVTRPPTVRTMSFDFGDGQTGSCVAEVGHLEHKRVWDEEEQCWTWGLSMPWTILDPQAVTHATA